MIRPPKHCSNQAFHRRPFFTFGITPTIAKRASTNTVLALGIVILSHATLAPRAGAAGITVDGVCTLVDAIVAANSDVTTGACPAGSGPDIITLDVDVDLTAAYATSTLIGGGRSGLPDITSTLVIAAGIEETINRSSGTFRLFYVSAAGQLTLEGVTVSNGRVAPAIGTQTAAFGGGIYLDGGRLDLTQGSTLTENRAKGSQGRDRSGERNGGNSKGGGIYAATNSVLNIVDSALSNNVAKGGKGVALRPGGSARGGAVYSDTGGTITVSNSTLNTNSAPAGDGRPAGTARGGAIFSTGASLDLSNSTLSGNVATGGNGVIIGQGGNGQGGGIYTSDASITTLFQCTLSSNTASGGQGVDHGDGGDGEGGGLFNSSTNTIFSGCTVSGNGTSGGSAGSDSNAGSGRGGGLFDSGTNTKVTNSTFSANTVIGGEASNSGSNAGNGHGGGIYTASASVVHATVLLNSVSAGINSANASRNGNTRGEGIYSTGATLTSSIVASPGGATNDCRNLAAASNMNLGAVGDTSCASTSVVIDTDIEGTLAANGSSGSHTHALLLAGSEGIDGTGGSCPAAGDLDQRGLIRDGNCDVGAFEYGTEPVVSFSLAPTTIYEAGGVSSTIVTATATNLGSFEATVDFEFSGTAAQGIDYVVLGLGSSSELTLTSTNNPATFQIFALSDSEAEGSETAAMTMNHFIGQFSTSGTNPQSFEIVDNFPGELTVAGSGDGNGAMVSGGTFNCGSTAGTTSGDCSETPAFGTVLSVFASAGGGDTFTGWSGCDSTSTQIVTGDRCHVAVTSDITVTANFVFTTVASLVANDETAAENPIDNGQFTVDLGRNNSTGNPIALSYSVTGSASPSHDFNTLSGNVQIPAGSQTATIDVVPFDDQTIEGDETVVLSLTGAGATGVSVNSTSATVIIADDDSATLTVDGGGSGYGAMIEPGTIDCHSAAGLTSGDCLETPAKGTVFMVIASPDSSSIALAGWTGCDSLSTTQLDGDTCHVTVTSDRTITATFIDATPPQVTEVISLPDFGDNPLSTCDTATRTVSGFSVRFDEPMLDPVGDADPDDVTYVGNYQLVTAGPDRTFQTETCGGVMGDDLAQAVTNVTYDSNSFEATLSLAGPLEDDLYRLLICGSTTLRDLSHNALDGDANGAGGDDHALSFRLDAHNLFENGHLDCDLGSWFLDSTIPQEISYDPSDFESSNESGSAMIQNLVEGQEWGMGQCFDIESPGIPHQLSASYQLTVDPTLSLSVVQACLFFDSSSCSGSQTNDSIELFPTVDTGGTWVPLEGSFTPPLGTSSAFCSFYATVQGTGDFQLHFDSLFANELPIFMDGFESGDTTLWSESVGGPP